MSRGVAFGIVGLVAGLALGIALGTALHDPAPASSSRANGSARESASGETSTPTASASAERRRAASEASARPEDLIRRATASSAESAALPADAASAAAGEGTIRGIVRQPDGSPAVGVLFVLTQQFPVANATSTPQALPERLPPIEERLRKAVERERWIDATRRTATSGADGRFAFEGLPNEVHGVQGSPDGWQINADPRAWKCRPGDELRFTATRTSRVRVRVVQPDGTPPATAKLWFEAAGRSEQRTWSREDEGVVAVPAGRFRVRAEAGAMNELTCEPVEAEIASGEENSEIVLTLTTRPGVGGRVKYDPNAWGPQGQATVHVTRAESDEVPSFETFQRDGRQVQVQFWDQGTYSVTGLLPGRYAIALVFGGLREPVATWTVDVGASFVLRDLDPGPPDRSRFVEVTSLDPDGRTIREGLQFGTAIRGKSRNSSNGGVSALPREDGSRWVLSPSAAGADADTRWFVRVTHADFGTREAEYKPGPEASAEVKFVPPAFADVAVDGWAAHPQRDLFSLGLRIADVDARNRGGTSEASATPDANGRARLGPVAPGDYEVVVWLKRGRGGTNGVATFPVTLAAGTSTATVQLPPLYTLVVDLGRERAGKRLRLIRAGSGEDEATADASGRAVASRLLAGELTLRVDGERETKTVRVPDVSTFAW